MSNLSPSTLRRLQKIPQIPSVWEGDRRSLANFSDQSETEEEGDCLLWIDGSEGVVRVMEMVSSAIGMEAMARTLIRAIETPQSPARPARPQKIIVRDREIQFFLRGAIQGLDITIEYVPDLPLIDELFRSFEAFTQNRPPRLPAKYAQHLLKLGRDIWEAEPWELLSDSQILAVKLNQWDIETLYASFLGMLGEEYGIILYRSLQSLKRFRASITNNNGFGEIEKAFLSQDCWFLNYESIQDENEDEDEQLDLTDLSAAEIRPIFGSIHPYEGIRPFLDEEEAIAIYVALKALLNFFESQGEALDSDDFPELKKSCRVTLPEGTKNNKKTVTVEVSTLPEVAAELKPMGEDDEDSDSMMIVKDDLIPDKSFISIGMLRWNVVTELRQSPGKYFQSQAIVEEGEGLPVILIQTTRGKAEEVCQRLQEEGGVKGIVFNHGESPFSLTDYDLGLIQTEQNTLYLFGEFEEDDSQHLQAKKNWERRTKRNNGYCALAIAMGLTGSSRGKPQPKHIIGLFETKALAPEELGIGPFRLSPEF